MMSSPVQLSGTYQLAGIPTTVGAQLSRFVIVTNLNAVTFPGNTYHQLIQLLQAAGFFRLQYSNYNNPHTPAWFAWATMFGLFNIQPPGKFESTIKGLKMHHICSLAIQDVMASV
jgi:hypothetical protein